MPQTIDWFRVESLLGQGGKGAVYKAFEPIKHRIVAIEIVRSDRDN